MKKLLTLVLLGAFLFGIAGTALANKPETKVNSVQDKKAAVTEKKAARVEDRAQRAELRQLAKDVKAKHKDTVALMQQIQAKRQQIKEAIGQIKENENTADENDQVIAPVAKVTAVSTDVKKVLSVMSGIKGLGVKNKGLWGDFNKAVKDKNYDQAKVILQQISDNIDAKNAQLKTISAMLDTVLLDLAK